MRRDTRKRKQEVKTLSDKIIMYSGIGVGVLAIIVISLLIYSKSLSDDVKDGTMSLEQMAKIAENSTNNENTSSENSTSVSTQIGKTVEEAQNELNNTSNTTNSNTTKTNQNVNATNTNASNNTNSITGNSSKTTKNNTAQTNSKVSNETKKELEFVKPVEGEITKEFAKENLIYSETLQEWTTHMGIDIKAEKTTVVKAAEAGTVKSIKNDPRYGLTIVIEHEDGFKTIYANLLTSEFVVEGEKIEKGQSIGTVGNTGVFESADEPHLHFEILKDSIQVDPSIYIK